MLHLYKDEMQIVYRSAERHPTNYNAWHCARRFIMFLVDIETMVKMIECFHTTHGVNEAYKAPIRLRYQAPRQIIAGSSVPEPAMPARPQNVQANQQGSQIEQADPARPNRLPSSEPSSRLNVVPVPADHWSCCSLLARIRH